MNTNPLRKLLSLVPIALLAAAWQPATQLLAQAAKSAAPAGSYNVVKEIMDHKDTLNWKPTENGIPGDVCTLLQLSLIHI